MEASVIILFRISWTCLCVCEREKEGERESLQMIE